MIGPVIEILVLLLLVALVVVAIVVLAAVGMLGLLVFRAVRMAHGIVGWFRWPKSRKG